MNHILRKKKKIDELNNQIIREEKEIRANKHLDTQQQKIDKAKQLMPLLYEKFRIEWIINYTEKFTGVLNDNSKLIEKKIQQLKFHRNIKKANEIIEDIGEYDTQEEIKINLNSMMRETANTKKEIELMDSGSIVINKGKEMPDMDTYLKNLFN